MKKKSRPAAVKKNTAPVKYRISHFSITPAVKPVTVSRSRPVQITVQVETQEALRADYYFYMRQITREKILPAVRIFYYPGSRIVNGRSQIQFNFSGSLLYNGKRLPAGAWLLSCDVIFKNENNHTLGKSTMSWGGRSQSVLPEDLIYIK
ncbi:MAG TPA: hypothetical protein DC049_19215 [Spirochaetia bacterium]|nr:hypothetical protein [Spirochaetia bacterium]